MIGFAPVNDTRLYYEVAGRGSPVVLIHGFGIDARMWDAQFPVVAERHRVIRYDLRGFGRSALPTGNEFRHADDLRALLDYLETPAAHVVGLSMGGTVALHHTLLFPDATASLVLVDSSLDRFDWSEEWDASFDAIAERAQQLDAAAGNTMWLEHELFAPARERAECRVQLERIVRESSGWHWLNDSRARGIVPPGATRLNEIRVPTLVIVGERDLPDFQRIADILAGGIGGARKVVMQGVGHMSNMENSGEFNAVVEAFFTETEMETA